MQHTYKSSSSWFFSLNSQNPKLVLKKSLNKYQKLKSTDKNFLIKVGDSNHGNCYLWPYGRYVVLMKLQILW